MSRTLFYGLGSSAPMYYRCLLPALHLRADWCGGTGDPDAIRVATGIVNGRTQAPNFADYDAIILQQQAGPAWRDEVRRQRDRGARVLYEIDDFIHKLSKAKDHDFADYFTPKYLRDVEMVMRECDGLIVSTERLARKYRRYNPTVYVCVNGIDRARYALTRPKRENVGIGWAGATGHRPAFQKWAQALADVMATHPNTYFVSIGQRFADAYAEVYGQGRALSVPFCMIEQYPAALTLLDVALAPAGDTAWALCKSQLRHLEASALGIATIGDPRLYTDIEHGVTGLYASTGAEAREAMEALVSDRTLRDEIGRNAREWVMENRAFPRAADQWAAVIDGTATPYGVTPSGVPVAA